MARKGVGVPFPRLQSSIDLPRMFRQASRMLTECAARRSGAIKSPEPFSIHFQAAAVSVKCPG